MAEHDQKSSAPKQEQKPTLANSGVKSPTPAPSPAPGVAPGIEKAPPQPVPQQQLGGASPDVPLTEEERKEAISHGLDAAAYRQLKAQGRL